MRLPSIEINEETTFHFGAGDSQWIPK